MEDFSVKEAVRHLPPIHELQNDDRFQNLIISYSLSAELLTELIQEHIQRIRNELLKGIYKDLNPSKEVIMDDLFNDVEKACGKFNETYLRQVINATGTVLHTNLGRARLSEEAISQVVNVARSYSNLEYNLEKGTRGSRHDIIEDLLIRVTGAEAAMVVNNNAAAVYFILRAFANNKNVIVSRGQLIEIGGSFRISSIMEESGANLIEVGTTNKTHLYDYENAVDENTAMIMKIHTSNFKTIGFTKSVETKELVELCNDKEQVIFYEDLGSGVLFDYKQYSVGDEPVVAEVLQHGADLVSFSGDKLLGGPQAGIIAGKKALIDKLKKHQLARVLRVDKMTFAALEATLQAYLRGGEYAKTIPAIRDITDTKDEIKVRAQKFVGLLNQVTSYYDIAILEDFSQVGGGTMPDVVLPTYVVAIRPQSITVEELASKLRQTSPAVIARVKNDMLLLDFRTITEEEIQVLVSIFKDQF